MRWCSQSNNNNLIVQKTVPSSSLAFQKKVLFSKHEADALIWCSLRVTHDICNSTTDLAFMRARVHGPVRRTAKLYKKLLSLHE
jgi:hypothetical protein